MMTMRVVPAAAAATLRFSLNEQSPRRSAEALAAVRRRAREVRVRMFVRYAVLGLVFNGGGATRVGPTARIAGHAFP
jgi:hypothetical protein